MSYKIEKLSKENVDDVFELEKTYFGITKKDNIASTLTSDTLDYYVLFSDEIVVGFFECSIVLDEAELFDIAVKQEYQGLGLSKMLMDFFFNLCKEKNIRTIFLEVNSINTKAISLYKKYGFVSYLVRKRYYGNNDAILMKYEFLDNV